MNKNNMINEIIKKIEKFENIAIFTHISIDGDSYSSSYGLALAIKQKYPNKKVKVFTDVKYLKDNFPFLEAKPNMFQTKINKNTLGIIGDSSIKQRIQFFDQLNKCEEIICFDHHQNNINFNAHLFWKEPNYPASSLQATEIAFAMLKKLKENVAIALLFGILTDTGFFKYSTNNWKTPLLYSKLLKFTSDKKMNDLFIKMNSKKKEDITIKKIIYSNIIYQKNVAYLIIDKKKLNNYTYQQFKSKINSISNIQGIDYWAFFIETNENGFQYKACLRTSEKNVNQIAIQHNGGGHIKASGCYAKNKNEIIEIVNKMIKL